MTLVLKPIGRGNWRAMTWPIDERRVPRLLVAVGQRIAIGGITFRIARIEP